MARLVRLVRQPGHDPAARQPGRGLRLPDRARRAGVSFATLSLTSCAIAFEHRRAGAADPTAHQAVGLVRRGLRRSLGTAPTRQARPLSVAGRSAPS